MVYELVFYIKVRNRDTKHKRVLTLNIDWFVRLRFFNFRASLGKICRVIKSEGLRGLKFNERQASGVYAMLTRPSAHLALNNYPHRLLLFSFNLNDFVCMKFPITMVIIYGSIIYVSSTSTIFIFYTPSRFRIFQPHLIFRESFMQK